MPVYRACYCTRRDVMSATDIEQTQDFIRHVDSALMAASDSVDDLCHRRFYNILETKYWDWPNYQYAYPWRIWFDQRELADVTVNVPVVTTGGTVIPSSAIFWGPWNYSPPYTFMELDRSQSYTFGLGPTPQRDVSITGLFGYSLQTRTGGALAAAVSSTTATSITVTDSSPTGCGVGDVITVDTESMLVQDCQTVSTGVSFTGLTTALASDNQLSVASGAAFTTAEILTFDAERCLILSIQGNTLVLERAFDGTVLAEHTSGTIYADRQLTVERGFGGTTAATHLDSATIAASLPPAAVHELALAEALNTVLQKTSGYARSIGENATPVPGGSLPDLRAGVVTSYGRKARARVI